MRLINDSTGRFKQRPYYDESELDVECERVISRFMREQHDEVRFPISTDDLTKLLEQHVDDLDLYADLSSFGDGVEGMTEFRSGQRPIVRISGRLTEDPRLENRLRTTLTHEFGHVHFHGFLWAMDAAQSSLLTAHAPNSPVCYRDAIVGAPKGDWMEWQAGHACGALLMPASRLRRLVQTSLPTNQVGPIRPSDDLGRTLIAAVAAAFQVSQDAARVRLVRGGYLSENPSGSLF